MRKVLLVSFQFPPFAKSSGVQRAFRYAQYLPSYGWEPIVLTVWPYAYGSGGVPNSLSVPNTGLIVRVPAFNAATHFSFAGRYPRRIALPDQWASWHWLAPLVGRFLCHRYKVSAIWSSYPIATAHLIANSISSKTGLPWLADFRDPMVQADYPPDKEQRVAFRRVEELTAHRAMAMTFTTPSAHKTYANRYPDSRCILLENGFDASAFDAVKKSERKLNQERLVILHSGIVYPVERDPEPLFKALAELNRQDLEIARKLTIRFRAASFTDLLRSMANKYHVEHMVEVVGAIPYQEALQEMINADGLLILQASNCNEQIPAKLYEYLRAQRPILGLTDPAGDTGRKLLELGFPHVARLESAGEIAIAIRDFVADIESGRPFYLDREAVDQYSRSRQTGDFAEQLDYISSRR